MDKNNYDIKDNENNYELYHWLHQLFIIINECDDNGPNSGNNKKNQGTYFRLNETVNYNVEISKYDYIMFYAIIYYEFEIISW